MYVLTPDQMREADRRSIAAGIPALLLMENAAFATLRELERAFPDLSRQRIAIFCGKGNNGGDGLALARLLHLHHRPAALHILLAETPTENYGSLAAQQLDILNTLRIPVLTTPPPDLPATTLALDALLGTGATGIPREPIAALVRLLNALPLARRWSLDVVTPGLENVEVTVTFAAPKLDQVLHPDGSRLIVAPIGIPPEFTTTSLHLTEPSDLAPVLAPRDRASHKGSHGHVLVLGGAPGKNGALNLAGLAALRAGSGLVTLCSPDPTFRPHLPDLMQSPWPPDLSRATVLAIGPGLGLEHKVEFLEDPRPQVLDADALNQSAPWTQVVPPGLTRVLTPHPKEMSRLLGRPLQDPLEDAKHFAQQFNVTLVLKSHRTLIAHPNGETWINPTGSPALAKAGSGDVLTGFIAAFLAQFPKSPLPATLAAVYLHGLCGQLAAQSTHERHPLASDLPSYLPQALRQMNTSPSA